MVPPFSTSCANHTGHSGGWMLEWDGEKFVQARSPDARSRGDPAPDRRRNAADYAVSQCAVADQRGLRRLRQTHPAAASASPPGFRSFWQEKPGSPMLDAAQTETKTLLEVNNIEVIYNHVILVLKGVSLSVPKGGITALLGGNGAGKTTTLKAISNLLHSERGEVTKGSILYQGESVQHLNPAALVKRGVIQVMEGRHCFAPDRRGKPADRRLYAARRAGGDRSRS
jgi:ABC-type multidrug transport system fused ATPase/permease subunit